MIPGWVALLILLGTIAGAAWVSFRLDISPPEACTDWAAFAREQVAEAEARGWRKDANLGWVLDVPKPEKEAEK